MNESKKSKIKLIVTIICAVALVIILSLGVSLAVIYSKDNGKINISANEVNMTVSAEISGMKDSPFLPNITINENTEKEQGWENISLNFENKKSQIDLVITIKNNNTKILQVIFENNTTLENLYKEEFCYFDNDPTKTFSVGQAMLVNAGESLSYKITFKIKDTAKSVKNKLALNFICTTALQ